MKSNRDKKPRTQTSAFGTPGRISHDSSKFYASKMYDGITPNKNVVYIENPVPNEIINKTLCKSSEQMFELPDNSVHLMVTSPPYNVGKTYDQDLSLDDYFDLLQQVFTETHRVLVTGGRACVNVANFGRKPYIPIHSNIIEIMLSIGFLMRGEIIWEKRSSASASTAWGSWCKANNPVLRDTHEYVLVFSKGSFSRQNDMKRESTISKDEFMEFTKSVWYFPAERAKRVGHPAPFPIELPYRLIQLYTFENETILDPFMGSGSTAIAAIKSARNFVGYDTDQSYCELANYRVEQYLSNKSFAF